MSDRLCSLDLLRGLDMFVLTVLGPLVWAVNAGWGLPQGFLFQFTHPWEGFTVWDIIMPLFLFMCGAAIPLSLERPAFGAALLALGWVLAPCGVKMVKHIFTVSFTAQARRCRASSPASRQSRCSSDACGCGSGLSVFRLHRLNRCPCVNYTKVLAH